jgi:hypothetical protein
MSSTSAPIVRYPSDHLAIHGPKNWPRSRPGRCRRAWRAIRLHPGRAQVFQRMPAERGIATLLAFACALQATAQDDVLDVLDMLLTDLLARVDSQEKQRRLRTIGDMDVAWPGCGSLRSLSAVAASRCWPRPLGPAWLAWAQAVVSGWPVLTWTRCRPAAHSMVPPSADSRSGRPRRSS